MNQSDQQAAESSRNAGDAILKYVDEEEFGRIVAEQRRLQLKISEQNRMLRDRQQQLLDTVEQLQQREADASRLAVVAQSESRKLAEALEELKDAQEKLLRNEKLAAIGQLAATVSHELRNPLGAIRNAWYFINRRVRDAQLANADQRIGEFSSVIDTEMDRCAKIIGDLLDFSRERALHRVGREIPEIISQTFALVVLPAPTIRLVSEVEPGTPTIFIDEDQFRQVLINLIQNAVEAVDPERGEVRVSADVRDGWVYLEVIDNGPGVPEEARERIFEPLYTSKMRGTGLGLAIVASIVKRHGGTISVEPVPSGGAKFNVIIPVGEPSYGAPLQAGGAADLRKK